MDSTNRTQPSQRPMQDIVPPQGNTAAPPPEPKPQPEIPVEAQPTANGAQQAPTAQTTPGSGNAEAPPTNPDKELDNIIQEVHGQNASDKKPDQHKSSKPVMIAAIALVIALLLGVVAFFAFRNTEKVPVGSSQNNSSQNTQQTSDTENDVSSVAQEVDNQLNSLNDSQDFNPADISDATLGF